MQERLPTTQEIQQQLTDTIVLSETLRDQPESWYPAVISGLHEVQTSARNLAKEIGLEAVKHGSMTQKELAKQLGVHPITVGRWLTAHEVEQ